MKGDNLEDPGVDGRVILRWIFRKCNGSMDWVALTHDRDRWRARVNAIMNFRFPAFVLISQVSHLTSKMQCLVTLLASRFDHFNSYSIDLPPSRKLIVS